MEVESTLNGVVFIHLFKYFADVIKYSIKIDTTSVGQSVLFISSKQYNFYIVCVRNYQTMIHLILELGSNHRYTALCPGP